MTRVSFLETQVLEGRAALASAHADKSGMVLELAAARGAGGRVEELQAAVVEAAAREEALRVEMSSTRSAIKVFLLRCFSVLLIPNSSTCVHLFVCVILLLIVGHEDMQFFTQLQGRDTETALTFAGFGGHIFDEHVAVTLRVLRDCAGLHSPY